MFTTQTTLLSQINAARATGAIERKLQTLVRVPLLIVDDFGLKPLKGLTEIIYTSEIVCDQMAA